MLGISSCLRQKRSASHDNGVVAGHFRCAPRACHARKEQIISRGSPEKARSPELLLRRGVAVSRSGALCAPRPPPSGVGHHSSCLPPFTAHSRECAAVTKFFHLPERPCPGEKDQHAEEQEVFHASPFLSAPQMEPKKVSVSPPRRTAAGRRDSRRPGRPPGGRRSRPRGQT